MAELIVVGFKKDMYRASAVLNKLTELNNDWMVDLRDAVVVYRDYDGKLRVDQSYQPTTGEGAGWGLLWGALIGALIAIPFTGGASGAALAGPLAAAAGAGGVVGATSGALDAKWWKEEFGIPDEFAKTVGTMVKPGDSAVLAVLRSADPVAVAEQFRGYGGTVLETTLSKNQSQKIQDILSGRWVPKAA